ncbi:MAG: hypothetical protein KKB74_05345 [Bacteroidetes bacterium]|nr:hypothetical protein [Bacteroidota bacterium]
MLNCVLHAYQKYGKPQSKIKSKAPFGIYRMGMGELKGNRKAAVAAWSHFGYLENISAKSGRNHEWTFFKPEGQTLLRIEVFAYNL